jgi:type II secretory pathway pseudopilin PulG
MGAAAPGARRRRPASRGEQGYTLAVLLMMATVMSILVGAALPSWSKMIQRDKEEELIARGWQYAEGVRVFQNRFGRLPTSLDELFKVSPRCIRHLYKDPMTGEAFAPIFLNNPVTPPPGQNQLPQPGKDDKTSSKKNGRGSADDGSGGGFDPGKVKVSPLGPVIGVHSTSDKESSLLFYGRSHYNEWQFTVMMLTHRGVITSPGGGAGAPVGRGGGSGAGGGRLEASVRWLGRPPFNLAPGSTMQPPPGPRGGPPPPPSPHVKQKP